METNSRRPSLFALIALAALTAYILACTAFSPDDSKVLYPTVSAKTGATGIAVYDRATGKSELIFLPTFQDIRSTKTEPMLLRAQWLPGGKDILVAFPGNGSDRGDGLTLAVLPFGVAGPVKLISLSEPEKAAEYLQSPLPVSGHFLFLAQEGKSNTTTVIRIDLVTGELDSRTNLSKLVLLPAPQGRGLLYLAEAPGDTKRAEVGLLNPDTFTRTPVFQTEGSLLDSNNELGFVAVSRDGKRLAFADAEGKKRVCRILQNGKLLKTLSLPESDSKLSFGNAQFAPRGEILYVSFMDRGAGATNASFGVLEIPLDGGALRRNTLLQGCGRQDEFNALYFQMDLSNDGKTLAIASTYLAFQKDTANELKPENCALFLLNLADPQRPVTRVPIPLPPAAMQTN